MKKILISVCAVAFFGGVSAGAYFFYGKSAVQDGQLPKNPETEFVQLLEKSTNAWDEILKENLPSKQLLEKNQSTVSIKGNADLAQVVGGKLDFSFAANGKIDRTNTEDPKMDTVLDLFLELKDNPLFAVKIDMQGMVKFIEKSLFVSLQKTDVTIPDATLTEAIQSLKGKWFGMSSEEMQKMSENAIPLEAFFANDQWISFWNLWEEIKKDPKALFVFEKALPAEQGMFLFEVKLQEAFLKKMLPMVLGGEKVFATIPAEDKAEIDAFITKMSQTPFVIGFDPKNPEFILERFSAIDSTTSETLGQNEFLFTEKIISGKIWMNKNFFLAFEGKKENADRKWNLKQSKESKEQILLEGITSETKFLFDIFDPSKEDKTLSVHSEGEKTAEEWKGTFSFAEYPSFALSFEKLKFSLENATANFMLKQKEEGQDEKVLGTMEVASSVQSIAELSVQKPESFEPLQNMMNAFLPKETPKDEDKKEVELEVEVEAELEVETAE